MENLNSYEEELKAFSCSNCGAELKYKPGTKTLVCEYCDTKNQIHEDEIIIEELDFDKYIENLESENLEIEKIISCKNCGSTSSVDESVKSIHCPYCNSPLVQEDISEERFIKPGYLLPFNIEDTKIATLLSQWVDQLWFAPNNFKKAAVSHTSLKGVYVPYWIFNIDTHSSYTGKRGETRTYKVGPNDNQETKTTWYETSGDVHLSFDDMTISASRNISEESLAQLEPWKTKELVKANDQYLSGFLTEKYTIKLREGFETAKIRIDNDIRVNIRSDIKGDRQSIDTVNTQYNNIKFKHILLPVYISSYLYRNKMYTFYVNGRNGKLIGNRPYSNIKLYLVGMAIPFFVFLIIIIVFSLA